MRNMKTILFLIFILLMLTFFSLVYGVSFDIVPNKTSCRSGANNWKFNFTINNTNSTASIIQLKITLPDEFEFISDSSSTNTISNFNYESGNLSWSNSTGLIDANSSAWFSFNLSIPLIFRTVNFTFTILDNSSITNITNVSVAVIPETVSSSREFGLIPKIVYLNWTNNYQTNLSVLSNSSFNISVIFANGTRVSENYSQEYSRVYIRVKNNTNEFATINFLPSFGNTNYTLLEYCYETGGWGACKPGRYFGIFTVKNSSNSSENASLEVIVDLPVNLNLQMPGYFNGEMPANATQYHSFYFNTSDMNATSITLNLNFSVGDLDVFLLTNEPQPKLLTKSINKEGRESLTYNFINNIAMFEIRIYGNSSSKISYNGSVILLALNSSEHEFDFGVQNVSGAPITKIFNLTNEGNIPIEIVEEKSEMFYVKRFEGNGQQNFTFFLPDSSIIPTLKVKLNWKGEGAYNLTLFNPDGIEVGNSSNKYKNAEMCKVEKEEFIEASNSEKVGLWRVEVKNVTTETPDYTLTIQAFVNSTKWIKTNFSEYINKTFNTVGEENSTKTIELNFTIPEEVVNGVYEGFLSYKASNGGKIKIPIKVNVTTPMLVVDNTLRRKEILILENYRTNLTKTFYINISNFGDHKLTTTFLNSSRLRCVDCSYFVDLSFNKTAEIQPHTSNLIEVNVTLNSSIPKSLYEGWIYINSTHPTDSNLTSHPYASFNISIKLNLTDRWNVTIVDLISGDYGNNTVNVSSKESWVNVSFLIQYVNGTNVKADTVFSLDNITNVWLFEPNASYFVRNLVFKNITPPKATLPTTDIWTINLTIPKKVPGGRYYIHINLTSENLTSNPSDVYRGESLDDPINKMLIVDDMGLLMSLIEYPSELTKGSSGIVNVSIKNLGPKEASNAQITLEKCSSIGNVAFLNSSCIRVGSPSEKVNFTLSAYNYTGCYIAWGITANTTGACRVGINGTSGLWFGNLSFDITITSPPGEITTTTTIPTTTTTTTSTTTTTTSTTIPLPPQTNFTTTIPKITPDSPAVLNVHQPNILKIKRITIFVKKNVSNVMVNVKEGVKSSDIPLPVKIQDGLVFKYLEISHNISENDIASVSIDFQVEKSWIIENNIDASTVHLYRFFNNSWEKLQTTKINETSDTYEFRAISPGLSLFAIIGNWATSSMTWIILLALGIIVAGILAFLFWPTEEKPIIKEREEIQKPWEELRKKWEELKKKKRSS